MFSRKTKTAIAAAAIAWSLGAQAQITDQQIKDFFATNPTPEQIAAAAASLGMNLDQVSAAMAVGGYGGAAYASKAVRDKAISDWVGSTENGYYWGANGALRENGNTAKGAAAAKAARDSGVASYGQGAPWAVGAAISRICPEGMSVGLNKAGMPKCVGTPNSAFPTGEAQINVAAQATAAQAVANSALVWADQAIAANVIPSNTVAQGYKPEYYGSYSTAGALSETNYSSLYEKIVNDAKTQGVTVGVFIGDTIAYTKADMKSFFDANPTTEQILAAAAKYRFTPSQAAQAISMMQGAPYDPDAVRAVVAKSSGYAISPVGQIMALTAGMTKTPDGQLTIPAKYNGDATQFARDWTDVGNAWVNSGKIIYTQPANTIYDAKTGTFIPAN